MTPSLIFVTAVFGLLAGPANAERQTYAMMLDNRQIGTLVFEGQGSTAKLQSTINNTPLGVANGLLEATSRAKGNQVDYVSKNQGSKAREIKISREANIVTTVIVNPDKDMTELSDGGKVPAGVIFPTELFSALANGGTCLSPMAMYDGRRVVQISTTAMKAEGENVTCDMSYRVVMGPGHLSPLRFKLFGMQTTYAAGMLTRITMSAGGFKVNLIRK